ncbi:MAG TPA: hypothetical protein DCO75_13500 [Fibrobacteres bacterium]|nr:hypothetical protein [Fibrobacterota bacterium]
MTYIILHDTSFAPLYDSVISLFKKDEILLIKPITKEEINIIGVPDDELNSVPKAIDALRQKCPDVQVPKKEKPNAKIVNNGILVPIDPTKPCQFSWEKRNRIHFYFLFESKMDHINIGVPNNICDNNVTLEVNNLTIQTNLRGQSLKNKLSGKIVPPGLVGMLESNQRGSYCYRADILFGPCRTLWGINNFWQFTQWDWRRMWFKPYRLKIAFNIAVEVPGKYFTLTKNFRNRYFTASPDDFERIFSPEDIVQYINVKPMKIGLRVISR